jgi:hypothetical protein
MVGASLREPLRQPCWRIILVLIVMLILAPFDFENEDEHDEEDCPLSPPRRTMARHRHRHQIRTLPVFIGLTQIGEIFTAIYFLLAANFFLFNSKLLL